VDARASVTAGKKSTLEIEVGSIMTETAGAIVNAAQDSLMPVGGGDRETPGGPAVGP